MHRGENQTIMTFYMFHIADFYAATRHLTFEERAIYRELLDIYYDQEKPLTLDIDKLARLVCCRTEETKRALQGILDEFFIATPDGYRSSRADEEIARYHEKRTSLKERADKRWRKPQESVVASREGGDSQTAISEPSCASGETMPAQCNGIAAAKPSSSPALQLQLQKQVREEEPPLPPSRGGRKSSTEPVGSWSELPEGFDTEEFRSQWLRFLSYRKEIRKPLLSKRSETMTWETMSKHGVDKSIKAMQLTIEKGWQGIFWTDVDKVSVAAQRAVRAAKEHAEKPFDLPEL